MEISAIETDVCVCVCFHLDYQNSLALSSSEQEDILKVSRNISSCESYNDDQSYHSRGTRDSHVWSSYRYVEHLQKQINFISFPNYLNIFCLHTFFAS